jgi:predicted small secreted protein
MKPFYKICIALSMFLTSCATENSKNDSQVEKQPTVETPVFQKYEQSVDLLVSAFQPEKKLSRDSTINELKANPIYSELVTNKVVSQKYLPLLSVISSGMQSVGDNGFDFPEADFKQIENDKNSVNFVISTMKLVIRGGLNRDLIDVYHRYLSKYRYYNKSSTSFFDANGQNQETLQTSFNISAMACVLEPTNKDFLEAFYKSFFAGLMDFKKEDEAGLYYPYLAKRADFYKHLKSNNIDSQYNYSTLAVTTDVIKAGYFEVQVKGVKFLPTIKTVLKTYKNENGSYIILSVNYKNLDNESSTVTNGELVLINDSDKEFSFDKTEFIVEAKYKYLIPFSKLNPLSSETYDFIYAIPNGRFDILWKPTGGNVIYIGYNE